jgi:hypothetical protein
LLNDCLSEIQGRATAEQEDKNEAKENAQPAFQIHHQQLF